MRPKGCFTVRLFREVTANLKEPNGETPLKSRHTSEEPKDETACWGHYFNVFKVLYDYYC